MAKKKEHKPKKSVPGSSQPQPGGTTSPGPGLGIPCFDGTESVSEDAARKDATEAFIRDVESAFAGLPEQPHVMVIQPDEWKAWCFERGLPMNRASRSQYVAERVLAVDKE